MSQLTDKIALVTGAAAGIGAAIARRFVQDGARVLICDINIEAGQKLVAELGSENAVFQTLDVTDDTAFAAAFDAIVQRWGRLDILVNNAGVALPAEPVHSTRMEDFDRLVRVNLRSAFLGCQLAYPHLLKSKGCVLNISSMAGITGQARHAAYGATKGALNALTKCMAVDWGPQGIRVNALCPCGVWTETLRDWAKHQPNAGEIEEYLKRIHALHYCPEPAEIAAVAAFLCSNDAGFVTGALMPVSGGSECGYNLEK